MFWSCCALCPTGGSQPKSMLLKPSTVFTTAFAMISTLSWSGWLQVSSISFLIIRSWCHFPHFHYLLDFQIASKHPQGSNQIWAQGPKSICTIRDEAFGVLLLAQRTTTLKGTGWKQNTRRKLRLFESDDEGGITPTANEAALMEESGCESGNKRSLIMG